MANLLVKDGAATVKYLKATGAGTDADPHIAEHAVTGPLTDAQLRAAAVPIRVAAYTTPTHSAPTAGVASGAILAANANRLYALFVNDSDTTVYLALGVPAVANRGIRLNANGGSYEMSSMLGNLYVGAVNGISGIAGKVVLVCEGV